MAVHPILKDWKSDPTAVAAHEESAEILAAEQCIAASFPSLTTEKLGELYFANGTTFGMKSMIVAQGHAPYEAIRDALFCGEPMLGEVACVHHKMLDADLEEASRTHKWGDVRREIARVLKKRRERGYDGPADLVTTNRAG